MAASGNSMILTAAHADLVVELDELPAARALAPDLVALEPVEDGGQEPEARARAAEITNHSRNEEPFIRPTIPPARPKKRQMIR